MKWERDFHFLIVAPLTQRCIQEWSYHPNWFPVNRKSPYSEVYLGVLLLSVDKFASELSDCLSVDEFASEVTDCLSIDEFASGLTITITTHLAPSPWWPPSRRPPYLRVIIVGGEMIAICYVIYFSMAAGDVNVIMAAAAVAATTNSYTEYNSGQYEPVRWIMTPGNGNIIKFGQTNQQHEWLFNQPPHHMAYLCRCMHMSHPHRRLFSSALPILWCSCQRKMRTEAPHGRYYFVAMAMLCTEGDTLNHLLWK